MAATVKQHEAVDRLRCGGEFSFSVFSHLGNVLLIQAPRLGEELETVAVAGQVAGGNHDGPVVQVALGDA